MATNPKCWLDSLSKKLFFSLISNLHCIFWLITFRVIRDCTDLELVHKTQLNEIPTAICSFQGRVAVGVGKLLRLYDMGQKKLLRKCENKVGRFYQQLTAYFHHRMKYHQRSNVFLNLC